MEVATTSSTLAPTLAPTPTPAPTSSPKSSPKKSPQPETPMSLSEYSEKSIKISGTQSRKYTFYLDEMHGRYNPKLKGGPGWIFSKKQEEKVKAFLQEVEDGTIEPKVIER